jgi:phage-related protein
MAQTEFYSREINILRQSQQKMAFDVARSKGVDLTVMELQRMTDIFVELCLRPMDKDLKDRVNKLDKWLDDKSQLSIEQIKMDGLLIK